MTDRFLIGGVLGARAVTDYTVPFQLATRTAVLPGALVNALFPRLSSASPESQRVLAEKATIALTCLLSPLFVGGIFLMGPFLQLWVGDQIGASGAWVGRIILVTTWINALSLVSYTKLQASGRPDTVSKIIMLEIPI
jgi:O-antigen/teichoic acid export membrane protein